jgi:hypothetical protein
MSLSSTGVYEVRTTGNNANSGLFNPAGAGANNDYTQQNSPQFTYTDLVIGATTTNLTSAARPFSTADRWNSIRISGGAGFTTGLYEITDVVGNVAVMDRSVGTAASTSGAGRLGGALLTLATAFTTAVLGNIVWGRSGLESSAGDVYHTIVTAGITTAIVDSISLWRELTNERSRIVVPDFVAANYITAGLEAVNRRVRYHYTDTTTAVTLVAGTQEYAAPTDVVEIKFIELGGKLLTKSAIEEYRRKEIMWRQETSGYPEEWAFYNNKLVFRPTPSAAAVAADSAPFIRYVSTPPSFMTNGMEQLNSQFTRVPVYWAVAEWSRSHPDSALAQARIQTYQAAFDQEMELAAAFYALKTVQK